MTQEDSSKDKSKLQLNFWLVVILAGVIFVSLFLGLIFSGQTNIILAKKLDEIREAERPAELEIIVLQDENCPDCFDLKPLIDAIKKENVKVNSERVVEMSSEEGQNLIKEYNITKLPTFIIKGEIEKEADLKSLWPKLGEVKENTFILRQAGAPYVLTSSGEVKGRVKVIMLTDRNCRECYDVTVHEAILRRFGIVSKDSQVVDVNFDEGKELVDKYSIKLLPTLILSGDINTYPALIQIWSKVGTIEDDGIYVFREGVKQMGVYKDLITNEIVKPDTS